MRQDKTIKTRQGDDKKVFTELSFVLKKKIMQQIINGRMSRHYASVKYSVAKSTIDYWLKKFTTLEEKQKYMSKEDEIKKLKERIEELELIKDFQQDLIVEFELETGKELAKKYLPGHLAKEIEKKKRASK